MKFHSDTLETRDIYDALARAKSKGHVPNHVYLQYVTRTGSRSHKNAYEVTLYSDKKTKGDKRRFKNSGHHGASPEYAATYDEWGFFMAEIYAVDSFVVMGTVANGPYRDETEFSEKTHGAYPIVSV